MARYTIPKSPGEFIIQTSMAGTPVVWNKKSGRGKVLISCRDQEHAEQVLTKIKELGNKGGEIWA